MNQRTAQRVVTDLEEAGYLSRERDGRRTRYHLHLEGIPPFGRGSRAREGLLELVTNR
ncbi:hypothetical protein AB0907_33940 [Streptomyces sp. NPDC006975]|uniref:hypothetical protein n=1 Tax=Streptomyces sp. NPDC006975 TaxID=3154310 RepID=UPI003453321C